MKLLVIFCRRPQLGRVKTRLAKDIGAGPAVNFYRHSLNRTLRHLGRDGRWQLTLALTPDHEARDIALRLVTEQRIPAVGYLKQGVGDLGHRMQHCLAQASHHMQTGPVVIVGSDIPDIQPAYIADAFKALQSHDTVIGPSPDGGYWLIGWSARARQRAHCLQPVRWSTAHARDDSINALQAQGLSVAMTHSLNDIDTGGDYRAWQQSAAAN